VGPIKKGDLGAGAAYLIAVEEVIGRDIILVDCFFDQPQAQHARVKIDILLGLAGYGGDVM
jgi:hypothetical protein